MALEWANRVLMVKTAPGTSHFAAPVALTGFLDLTEISDAATCHYSAWAVDSDGLPSGDFEVGIGTRSGTTLQRTTVERSSNNNNKVDFGGTVRIAIDVTKSAMTTLEADIDALESDVADLQAAPSGGFTQTAVKTADYTAVSGDDVLVDTNGAAGDVTITLPASPAAGAAVRISLVTDHATRICDIDRNSSNINGAAANPTTYYLMLEGDSVTFVYKSGDVGWAVQDDTIRRHKASLRRAAAQSINSGSDTKIQHDTEDYDIGGIGDLTNFRITVRRAGKYLCGSFVSLPGIDTVEFLTLKIFKNGSTHRQAFTDWGTFANQDCYAFFSKVLDLAAGDYIEQYVNHSEGAAQNTYASGSFVEPYLEMSELAP